MGKVQKVSSKEFKEEAVRLAQTLGKSITQIARELGISESAIHNWRKELAEHGEEVFTLTKYLGLRHIDLGGEIQRTHFFDAIKRPSFFPYTEQEASDVSETTSNP